MSRMTDKIAVILATGFGSGYSPKAPGTAGTLAALPLIWMVQLFLPDLLVYKFSTLLAIYLIGLWSTSRVETLWNSHDDQRVVIDEMAGLFTTLIWFPLSLDNVIAGFALFRIFDIWKPGIIGTIDEEWPGAWGTFFDDIAAGLLAAAVILGFRFVI